MDGTGRVLPGETATDGASAADGGRQRDSLFLTAMMTIGPNGDGGHGIASAREVRVRNLSAGGLMVQLDEPVPPGTAVTLDLRGVGRVTGSVAWHAEGRLGIAFDRQIDPKRARKPVGAGDKTPTYAKAALPTARPRR